MSRWTLLVVLVLSLATFQARADFIVRPAQDAAQVASDDEAGSAAARGARTAKPRFKAVAGFGDEVPLSFAVKQIVPPAVRVSYGPGANPGTVVTWKGGESWNRVLFDAVKSLGLRLVMSTMAVEIRN